MLSIFKLIAQLMEGVGFILFLLGIAIAGGSESAPAELWFNQFATGIVIAIGAALLALIGYLILKEIEKWQWQD